MASDHLRDFQIQQMWRTQALPRAQHPLFDLRSLAQAQQHFDHRRCINDNHRASRSCRTASAPEIGTDTGSRFLSLSLNSSTVGPSSACVIVLIRYSDNDIPAIAARAFTIRCRGSGKLRNCTITVFAMCLVCFHAFRMSRQSYEPIMDCRVWRRASKPVGRSEAQLLAIGVCVAPTTHHSPLSAPNEFTVNCSPSTVH